MASVTEAGHGFTIETPNGKVVDLGTEFGVTVDDLGVSEVSVFQGKVEAFPSGKRLHSGEIELTKGRGLQWDQDNLIPLDADLHRFAASALGHSTGRGHSDVGPLLVDQFRSGSIDPKKWKTLGSVQPSIEGVRLHGDDDSIKRPYLISVEQFNPSRGAVTVTCDFRFLEVAPAAPPSLSILMRSTDERGIALPPWRGTLASCARCSFGSESGKGSGVLQAGVKLESNRELSTISLSDFHPPSPDTPYRVVMRDDGVNVSFTLSLRDDPSTSKTVRCRSLFRGQANFVALEGSCLGTTLIERVEVAQDLSAEPLSTYSDFAERVFNSRKLYEAEQRLLTALAPNDGELILQDDFESGSLDEDRWRP